MAKLTSRDLLPASQISNDLLVHVVDPNDTTEDPEGSSFKGVVSILGAPSSVKEGLVVIRNTTNPTYQVDIDASKLSVGRAVISSINLTVDLTASGANGLDTGSEASSTWYSLWVIYNPTTGGVAGLLSASLTSPTLPSGYLWARRVGFAYNNSSGDIDNFRIVDDFFHHLADTTFLVTMSTTSFTSVSITADFIPNIETVAEINGYVQITYNAAPSSGQLFVRPTGSSATGILLAIASNNTAGDVNYDVSSCFILVNSSRQFQYSVASSSTIDLITMSIKMFKIPDLSIYS